MNFTREYAISESDILNGLRMVRKVRDAFALGLGRLMRSQGLSQKQFAQKFGTTEATVSRWMTAEKIPNYPTIDRICEFFSVDPQVLLSPDESLSIAGHGKIVLDLEKIAAESGYIITKKDS